MNPVSLSDLAQLAYNAYSNISFSPERRAASTIAEHEQELNEDLAKITSLATTDEAKAALPEQLERYTSNYRRYLTAWLSAKSRCLSSMITGPSNFPTRRAEKANQSEGKRLQEFISWREKALSSAKKALTPAVTPVSELETARKKLAGRERFQQIMKDANKIIRSGKDVESQLAELGFSSGDIVNLLRPDWANRTGFKDYEITNNGAEVRRLKARVSMLEAKEAEPQAGAETSFPFPGGRVDINREYDRVQIFHDEKPEPAKIQQIKSYGFRWSPSGKCWQRKDTPIARQDAQRITLANLSAK